MLYGSIEEEIKIEGVGHFSSARHLIMCLADMVSPGIAYRLFILNPFMIYAKTTVLRSPIKIDALVYQLYGLSDEEIKIVECGEK